MLKTKSIYVVVVTYNGSKWVDKCFGSLSLSTIPVSVIAIDNGSTDNTSSLIKNKFPGIIFIETGQNLGFGKANNMGIKRAYDSGADYVFLLNQDAWVDKDTIEQLIEIAEKFPEFGVLSPIHLDSTGNALDYGFSICLNPQHCASITSDIVLNKLKKEPYETSMVNAAAWLLSRKSIEIIGGFNPIFFLYGEDNNYAQRVRFHSLKLGISPNIYIYHERENREISEIIQNKIKFSQLNLLIKFSDPASSDNDIDRYILSLRKRIILSVLSVNFRKTKLLLSEVQYIKVMKPKISAFKKTSSSKGLSFLD